MPVDIIATMSTANKETKKEIWKLTAQVELGLLLDN